MHKQASAVDDRCHSEVTHLASALLVWDLFERVSQRIPEETLVPVRNGYAYSSGQRQGMPNLHCTIQAAWKWNLWCKQCQFRKQHPDQHYAATLFRYQHEFALKFCDYSGFICLDDKHRIKIGNQDFLLPWQNVVGGYLSVWQSLSKWETMTSPSFQ